MNSRGGRVPRRAVTGRSAFGTVFRKIAGVAALRWTSFALIITALTVLPLILFGRPVASSIALAFAAVRADRALVAGLLVALLAGDAVLPIPSSLLGVMAGGAFGWPVGALVMWTGLTLGGLVSYALGMLVARGVAVRVVGAGELERARRLYADVGPIGLVVTRAVPVLSEAVALAAGAARMPLGLFTASTALANVAVAVAYAGAGVSAASSGSLLVACSALALVPGVGWACWRWIAARRANRAR